MALERGALWALTILAFPFVYIWHFVCEPAKMAYEEKLRNSQRTNGLVGRIKNLELRRDTVRGKTNITLRLSFLVQKGREILVDHINEDQFLEWKERHRHWLTQTLIFLRSFLSHPDAARFLVIKTEKTNQYVYRVNDDHNVLLNQLAVQIQKLETRLEDYKEYWTTMRPDQRATLEEEFNRPVSESIDNQSPQGPAQKTRL
jgi:hypothetical protein